MPREGDTFINAVGVEVVAHGGSTPTASLIQSGTRAQVIQSENVAQDVYQRWYDARIPVFISLNDPSGLVIDRMVFDGAVGTGTSDYLVTVDSLIELRSRVKHKWGENEHSYVFPDPDNPPAPGDDLYPFYEWLLNNFPGWPDNGGIQPGPGWGGGTPPITSEPVNLTRPTLTGGAFVGQTITIDDGVWQINPAEISRTRAWFFDGFERTQLRGKQSYAPVLADWGARVTASVTVENADGTTTAFTSNSMVAGGVDPLEAHPDWELLNDTGVTNLYINGADNYAIKGNSTETICMVAFTDTNATDLIMDVTILHKPSEGGTMFPMVARYVDDGNWIGIHLHADGIQLMQRINGFFTLIAGPVPFTAPVNVQLSLLLDNWTLNVGGAETTGTTAHVARGRIGTVTRSGVLWVDGDVEYAEPWSFTALDEFEVVTPGSIAGAGRVGQTLAAADPVFSLTAGVGRQWMRDGTPIATATRNTYTVVEADRAANITCQFTANDQGRVLVSLSNSIYIAAPPLALTPPVIEGADTNPGVMLSFVSEGAWDTGGLPELSRTYQWRLNGTPIAGATSNTYVPPATGGNFSCTVAITTADGSIAQTSNVLGFAAVIPGTVTISGYLAAPSTLTCDPGNWQHNDTLTYQWQRDGADIAGATSATYTWVAATDNGTAITCVVTGENIMGPVSATSNALTPVALPPSNTALPSVSGGPNTSGSLICDPGTWTGDPAMPITLTYQWQRGGVDIVGQVGSEYDMVDGTDDNVELGCIVTGTNAAGPVSATSNTVRGITTFAYTMTVALIAGGPNAGFSVDQGDFQPRAFRDVDVSYFGSFGPSWFNIRTGGTPAINATTIHVTIEGLGEGTYSWSAVQSRYQGVWTDLQPNLNARIGQDLAVTIAEVVQ